MLQMSSQVVALGMAEKLVIAKNRAASFIRYVFLINMLNNSSQAHITHFAECAQADPLAVFPDIVKSVPAALASDSST
jgi:hypothetical protein